MSGPRENRMPLLAQIARGGDRGNKIADVICALIVQGGKLGELQAVAIVDEGVARQILLPPMIWMDRLMLAVERGAIEAMSAPAITQKILRNKHTAAPDAVRAHEAGA